MKKLTAIIAVIALICCLVGAVSAAEGEDIEDLTTTTTETTVSPTESVATTSKIAPAASVIPAISDSPTTEETPATEGEQPFTEWAVEKLTEYRTEILSGLSALLSMVLAAFIKALFAKQKDRNEAEALFLSALGEKVDAIEKATTNGLKAFRDTIERVDKLQEAQTVNDVDRQALQAVLETQEEMLNTIVQSSSMVQWKKDKIGKLHTDTSINVAKMKAQNRSVAPTEDGEASV